MTARCVPVRLDDGTVTIAQADGPLTRQDLDAIHQFRDLLKKEPMTDPTQPNPAPDVDLAPVQGWVFVLQQIKAQRAKLDETEAQAREHIEALMGDAVDGRLDGQQIIRYSHVAGSRKFNRRQFEKDHPGLTAPYITVGEPGRRLELVEPKAAE